MPPRTLRFLTRADWQRAGTQEGVGRITLLDAPGIMLRHDESHAAELAVLLAQR